MISLFGQIMKLLKEVQTMAKCEFCNKQIQFGIKVSHSHRRSNRTTLNVLRLSSTVHLAEFMPAPAAFVPVRLSVPSDTRTTKFPDIVSGNFLLFGF